MNSRHNLARIHAGSNAASGGASFPPAFWACYLLSCCLAILLNVQQGRMFLASSQTDGFTFQVNYIINYFAGGGKIFDLEPLLWIHVLRAWTAQVFIFLEDIGGSSLATGMVLLLMLPIVRLFINSKFYVVAMALPLVAASLSFRGTLVVISIAYIFCFLIDRRSFVYLGLSFVFANLSSGAVLNAIVIGAMLGYVYRNRTAFLVIYIICLFVSFYISATDKYIGFSEGVSGYNSTVYGVTGFAAVLTRNTIFISFMNGEYLRAAVYSSIIVVALVILVVSMRTPRFRGYGIIFLSSIPSFLLEGLGVVSLLVPVMLFVAGRPLPLQRSRPPLRAQL